MSKFLFKLLIVFLLCVSLQVFGHYLGIENMIITGFAILFAQRFLDED